MLKAWPAGQGNLGDPTFGPKLCGDGRGAALVECWFERLRLETLVLTLPLLQCEEHFAFLCGYYATLDAAPPLFSSHKVWYGVL